VVFGEVVELYRVGAVLMMRSVPSVMAVICSADEAGKGSDAAGGAVQIWDRATGAAP
jgi:hypothetical protein